MKRRTLLAGAVAAIAGSVIPKPAVAAPRMLALGHVTGYTSRLNLAEVMGGMGWVRGDLIGATMFAPKRDGEAT